MYAGWWKNAIFHSASLAARSSRNHAIMFASLALSRSCATANPSVSSFESIVTKCTFP